MDLDKLNDIFDRSHTKDQDSGCWIWSGLTDFEGRPVVREPGGTSGHSARRWAWQRVHGTISRSQRLRQGCVNPACVAPDHAEMYTGLPPRPREPRVDRRHGRPGPRPNLWVSGPDPETHRKYQAWVQQRNQAKWRGETWNLTFDQWNRLWGELWHSRGRERGCYCMTRRDHEGEWDMQNAQVITREQHAVQQKDMVERGKRSPRQHERRRRLGMPV